MLHTPDPASMPPEDRLGEVAAILATGFIRLQKKQKTEKFPLDKSPTIRPYGRKTTKGERP